MRDTEEASTEHVLRERGERANRIDEVSRQRMEDKKQNMRHDWEGIWVIFWICSIFSGTYRVF